MKSLQITIIVFSILFNWSQAVIATPIVIINEVLYDGPGADADDVFTELFGAPGLSLDGWSLIGINGADGNSYRTVILNGAIIPDDGILVITTSSATGTLLGISDFIANVDWQNGPDAIRLFNPDNLLMDALQYGSKDGFAAGEGSPAPDIVPGNSLSRDVSGTDTNDNSNDFVVLDTPTPGLGPVLVSVPEPGTLALMFIGMLSLIGSSHLRQTSRSRRLQVTNGK